MYTFYIAKATANFGLAATRPIYERAIETLPDRQTAEMCLRFANLERKLGEIDRARAIYAHASQFCDPRTQPEFWKEWNKFEIETGSEDTFREMRKCSDHFANLVLLLMTDRRPSLPQSESNGPYRHSSTRISRISPHLPRRQQWRMATVLRLGRRLHLRPNWIRWRGSRRASNRPSWPHRRSLLR